MGVSRWPAGARFFISPLKSGIVPPGLASCAKVRVTALAGRVRPKDEDCGACLSSGRTSQDLNEFAPLSSLRLRTVSPSDLNPTTSPFPRMRDIFSAPVSAHRSPRPFRPA